MAEIIKPSALNLQSQATNFIKFLGTAGARFVMIRQLRASAGLWVSSSGTNILIDPGPGSIVRCTLSKPRLDLTKLDAIILTHRHLDHCGDINVMIEAMTEGGFKKRGVIFCPRDALVKDSVILGHLKKFPAKIEILQAKKKYNIGNFEFITSPRHRHPVETYGIKFKINNSSVSLLSDTKYFKGLTSFYKSGILILNVVFLEPRPKVEHLSIYDAERLIKDIKPDKAILTHFGMTMLKAGPHLLAEDLTKRLKIEVLAAYDGKTLKL